MHVGSARTERRPTGAPVGSRPCVSRRRQHGGPHPRPRERPVHLVVAPRRGHGPLADDLPWAEGLRLSSEARTLVDNLAVSRGRGGRLARTLSRARGIAADLGGAELRAKLRAEGYVEHADCAR